MGLSRRLLQSLFSLLLLAACSPRNPPLPPGGEGEEKGAPPQPHVSATAEEIQEELLERSRMILEALARRDIQTLSGFVHPAKGVRFSPYGYVNVESDLRFLPEALRELESDTTRKTWGAEDGSGEPIRLSFRDYYGRFVWNHDFREAPQVSVDERLGQGNSLHNIPEVYPGSHFVEYHFPGFDPQYEGMDWASLRFVFEEDEGQPALSGVEGWFLIGIVHDQWTI